MKYLEIDLYKLENHPVGERLRMVFLSISNEYFVSCGRKSRKISDSFFFALYAGRSLYLLIMIRVI